MLMLAQPIDRFRTCAAKFLVLVPMVALVCLAAVFTAPGRPLQMFTGRHDEARAILILAPLCAICLAPALSMLCRSALAGVVFTVAIPGLLTLIGNFIATLLLAGMFVWFALTNHRSTERRVQRVALQLVTLIVTALCCLALPLALYAR